MMTDFQNRPGPITPDTGPGPGRTVFSGLLKILAALVCLVIAAVAAFIFIYLPSSYMKYNRFPVRMEWKILNQSDITSAASDNFKETDQQATALGFQPSVVFGSYHSESYRPEAKLYLSGDGRTAMIDDCFRWGPGIYCQRVLTSFFTDGRMVVTVNKNNPYNEPEPEWRTVQANGGYKDLAGQYQDHIKAVEKITQAGGAPVMLTAENVQTTIASFQDKTNQWRAEHGILEKAQNKDEYQLTYKTALNRVLITYKMRTAPK